MHDDLHEKQDNDRENGREERAAETEAGSIAMPLAEQPRQYRASRVIRPARVRPPVDASQYRPGEQLESYPTSAESSPAAVTKEASRSEPHGSHYDRASAHEQAVQAEYDARLAALEALEVAERERHDVPATSESISVPAAESVEPPRVEMRARSEGHATPPVGGGESTPPSFPHGPSGAELPPSGDRPGGPGGPSGPETPPPDDDGSYHYYNALRMPTPNARAVHMNAPMNTLTRELIIQRDGFPLGILFLAMLYLNHRRKADHAKNARAITKQGKQLNQQQADINRQSYELRDQKSAFARQQAEWHAHNANQQVQIAQHEQVRVQPAVPHETGRQAASASPANTQPNNISVPIFAPAGETVPYALARSGEWQTVTPSVQPGERPVIQSSEAVYPAAPENYPPAPGYQAVENARYRSEVQPQPGQEYQRERRQEVKQYGSADGSYTTDSSGMGSSSGIWGIGQGSVNPSLPSGVTNPALGSGLADLDHRLGVSPRRNIARVATGVALWVLVVVVAFLVVSALRS